MNIAIVHNEYDDDNVYRIIATQRETKEELMKQINDSEIVYFKKINSSGRLMPDIINYLKNNLSYKPKNGNRYFVCTKEEIINTVENYFIYKKTARKSCVDVKFAEDDIDLIPISRFNKHASSNLNEHASSNLNSNREQVAKDLNSNKDTSPKQVAKDLNSIFDAVSNKDAKDTSPNKEQVAKDLNIISKIKIQINEKITDMTNGMNHKFIVLNESMDKMTNVLHSMDELRNNMDIKIDELNKMIILMDNSRNEIDKQMYEFNHQVSMLNNTVNCVNHVSKKRKRDEFIYDSF